MLPSRKWRLLLLVLAFVWRAPYASAGIQDTRRYQGVMVNCSHSGAWIGELKLGAYSRARGYEQVFAGTVQSVVLITFTNRRLAIIPDEVFVGQVGSEVTATVNQGCLGESPEIKAGDRWVFYIRPKRDFHPEASSPYTAADRLTVVYDSPGRPVDESRHDICLLRHHADEDEECDKIPKTPHEPEVCAWEEVKSSTSFANPFPHPAPLEPLSTSAFRSDGINLMQVTPPREFRGDQLKSTGFGNFARDSLPE